jgi:hypothetical protein
MLKTGDVVWQNRTMINNVNYSDNKDMRLSVELFTTEIEGREYACTVPITNSVNSYKKSPKYYYHMPFLLLDDSKLSCVKLSAINLYSTDIMHSTSLTIGNDHIDRIFNKVKDMPYDKKENRFYQFVYQNIDRVCLNKVREDKEKKQQAKLLRKQKRKESKKIALV